MGAVSDIGQRGQREDDVVSSLLFEQAREQPGERVFRADPVVDRLSVPAGHDDSLLPKDPEVPRNGRLGHLKRVGEVAHAELASRPQDV